ncbi:hypothetical protein BGX26_000392 [Mortierella sp. AD094]|nr:hypothetical protein BGX26_000392 [Mortierella sp. AD094]
MQYNSTFESPGLEACAITSRAELLPASTAKALSMPELLDLIMKAVIGNHECAVNAMNAQGSICQLRLVSRAFHAAADAYFAVYIFTSPFEGYQGNVFRDKYVNRIRVCGPYIRRLDLMPGHDNDKELMKLIGDCCPKVEEVVLSFHEYTPYKNVTLDYLTLLKKWSSSTDTNNNIGCRNNIKKVLVRKNFDWNKRAIDKFEQGLERVREFLRGIDTFDIVAENPFDDAGYVISNTPHTSLYWKTFIGFFRSFPSLASFSTSELYIQWNPPAAIISSEGYEEMSFSNLTRLSFHFGVLDLSIISRLNRLFPKLNYLAFSKLVSVYDGENEPGGWWGDSVSSSLIPTATIATNPMELTVKRIQIDGALVDDVHRLLRVAPALKHFTCSSFQAQRSLTLSGEDLLAALKPFGGRRWDELCLYTMGSFQRLDWEKILNDASNSNDQ